MISGEGYGADYERLVKTLLAGGTVADPLAESSALPHELVFPEVFYPSGRASERKGFDVTLGNPPWDKIRAEARAFLAAAGSEYLERPPRTEKDVKQALAIVGPVVGTAWRLTVVNVEGLRRTWNRFAQLDTSVRQVVEAAGNWDAYRFFVCRAAKLLAPEGRLGLVIAGGFAKNPADSEVRRVILGAFYCEWLLHFVNNKKIFESLPPVLEFCLCVIRCSPEGRRSANIAFDLTETPALREPELRGSWSRVPVDELRDRVARSGTLVSQSDKASTSGWKMALRWLTENGLLMQDELNRTTDGDLFVQLPGIEDTRPPAVLSELLPRGFAAGYAGRNFYQYDDLPLDKRGRWSPLSEDAVRIIDRRCRLVRQRFRYFRLAIRKTCGSPKTNSRSSIATILRPGCTAGNSVLLESAPQSRPMKDALLAAALLNSFPFDAAVRPHIQANLNQSILELVTVPELLGQTSRFLVHQSLRLICNHSGFHDLWQEQLGDFWREPSREPFSWPLLASGEDREMAMATIDAVVASAYGLTRDAYEQILSGFNHSNRPSAPERCLSALDELTTLSLGPFVEKYDPYWDVPLNESLPQPVIDLPGMAETSGQGEDFSLSSTSSHTRKNRGRRR